MGDRISISFRNGEDTSVALFHHWGGMDFLDRAKEFVDELRTKKEGKEYMPLDRLEPSIVMVQFIHVYTAENYGDDEIESSLYLGKDGNDGDNSDNGHFEIDVNNPYNKRTT